jgi:hypothetical protein
MAKQETFIVTRQEMRRILMGFDVSEKSCENIFTSIEREHKHMNAIVLAGLLEKSNVPRVTIANIFRRIGIDDVAINNVLEAADEEKILARQRRLFNVTLTFS